MKKLTFGSIAIATLLATGSALAADIPAPAYKAPPVIVPLFSWTGFYIGGDIGGRWDNARWETTCQSTGFFGTCTNFPDRFANNNPQNFNSSSLKGGGYAGYNWQVNQQWVVGVEGDAQWANNTKTNAGIPGLESPTVVGAPDGDSSRIRQTWDASFRGRVGLLIAPTVMLFGTGGVAFTHIEQSASCGGSLFPVGWCGLAANLGRTDTAKTDRVGWTAGAGIEGVVWQNWLARAEYRYANYGTFTSLLLPGPTSNLDAVTSNVKLQTHSLLLGLAYKFDYAVSPAVVTKY
jgi:outer membrane immunogenic protein